MSQFEICVVDDDEAVRHSLQILLQRNGMRVTSFASPNELLKAENIDGYHCLLLDNHMPQLSGIELLEILRARRVRTPAIIITADGDSLLIVRATNASASAVLHKPVNAEVLLEALRCAAASANRS